MGDDYWREIGKQIEERRNASMRAAASKYKREHATDRRICRECGEAFFGWGTVKACDPCRMGPVAGEDII